jgi:CubicO group peptidase (beta-lactamase class C family)
MLLATLALTMASVGQGQADWFEPFPAHKIAGNVYYVGSKDLATFLITTADGHILINSGFERTVPLVQKSVESLGFKMTDVKILLASHAHGGYYGMVERFALAKQGQANAFVNPQGYQGYVAQKDRAFRKILAEQQAKASRDNAAHDATPVVPVIGARVRQSIAAKEVAGAVTLVASPDRILHLEATGNAVIDPAEAMRTDSIFWIASMSKPILATLLLMLQEEGLLSVDDPVEKYLPEFKGLKTTDGKPAPVTIRHLLTHTSGMGEITANQARDSRTLASVIPLYVARPVSFTPGSKWVYCQSGINTGGRIAEVVTGEPLEKLLKRRLFDPLGMRDTTFYLTANQLPRLAKSYRRTDKGELEVAAISFLNGKSPTDLDRFPAPNGGLFSTASDYVRFCQMVLRGGELDGKRYLKPETVKLMTTIQTADLKTGFTPGNGWGLGWCVIREPQGITAMLSPGTFGHGGAYGTQAWIDPLKKRIYLLMVQRSNFTNSDASEVRMGFQQAATAGLPDAPKK